MSLIESALTSFVVSGIWLAIVGFLCKSLIANLLGRELEAYKGKIAAQNIEHQVVLSRLHEKRADGILSIYLALIEYVDVSKRFIHQAEHIEENEREILVEDMSRSATHFRDVYVKNHLYLNESLCQRIQATFKEVQIPAHRFIFAFSSFMHSEIAPEHEYDEAWKTAFTTFADTIPPLLSELETEFRSILGVK
ncbi:hypothetical protein ACFFUP_10125 [Vibrio ostreicida]|uniref:DUF4760 domain-containing protein n=1 Tax=Vibrio ostreicida TaxID=526588 RepID=A0ABT8C1P7_9VIBR|nr:hypothetical protein [Vibrio ostreicida]MDN3611253.1 hypothetical protein [Vibrio ostreicida]MDN3612584.1 hypothetical protein [Vibrio ostreicida]NPD09204.1 hypothetical protein [Vibrio ostreicida]